MSSMKEEEEFILMNRERVKRSLKRIAFQIAEANRTSSPVLVVGMNDRGMIVGQELAEYLRGIYDQDIAVRQLMVETRSFSDDQEADDTHYFIVLADDVIFSGHTMFTALTVVAETYSPVEVHTVALIDRGHRKMPVEAQFCGMTIPTKLNEHVHVNVSGTAVENVVLTKN